MTIIKRAIWTLFQIALFIYKNNKLNMKLRICTLIAASCTVLSATAQNEKLTEYVNPMVGTDGYGNVYPGAQIPFGGIQISPDTDAKYYDAAAGYKYNLYEFLRDFHKAKTDIESRGKYVILCGGTGLYVESVLKGLRLPEVPENPELRHSLEGSRSTNSQRYWPR